MHRVPDFVPLELEIGRVQVPWEPQLNEVF